MPGFAALAVDDLTLRRARSTAGRAAFGFVVVGTILGAANAFG